MVFGLSRSRLESGFSVHVSFLSAYMNTRVLSFDIILTPGKHFKVKLVCFKSTMFLFFFTKEGFAPFCLFFYEEFIIFGGIFYLETEKHFFILDFLSL